MTSANKARLVAAVAFPLFLLHSASADCQPLPAPAAASAPVTQLSHISVEAIGKGPPVVMIPGLSMSRENWRDTAIRLSANHRVHLVQINGFGGTAAGGNIAPGLLDGVVADLHAYAQQQKIAGAAVVGHSLGGTLGLMYAKAHPADVGRLLVVDSLPWVGLIVAPPTAVPAMVEPQARMMRDQIAARYGQPVDPARHKAGIAQLALKPDSQFKAAAWSIDADPRVSAEAFYEDMMVDLRADLPAMTTPITLIYPYAATGPSKEAADALYRGAYAKTPHITYAEVPDSGHFVMLDQPAAFNTALDAFLAS